MGADPVTAEKLDCDLVHRVHDVGRRHDVAVGGHEDAGAGLGESSDPPCRDVTTLGPDDDDRGVDPGEQLADFLRERGRHGPEEDQSQQPTTHAPAHRPDPSTDRAAPGADPR